MDSTSHDSHCSWANRVGLAMFGTPFGWWLMPGTAWKMYLQHFRNPIARAQPNDGHRALAALERHWSSNADGDEQLPFMTITQNVDGLHQRAGAREVVEVHGTVYRHVCSRHRHVHPYVLDAAALPEAYDPATDQFFSLEHDYPTCPECHSYLRPDAVLFTESLPESAWRKADRAVQRGRASVCGSLACRATHTPPPVVDIVGSWPRRDDRSRYEWSRVSCSWLARVCDRARSDGDRGQSRADAILGARLVLPRGAVGAGVAATGRASD